MKKYINGYIYIYKCFRFCTCRCVLMLTTFLVANVRHPANHLFPLEWSADKCFCQQKATGYRKRGCQSERVYANIPLQLEANPQISYSLRIQTPPDLNRIDKLMISIPGPYVIGLLYGSLPFRTTHLYPYSQDPCMVHLPTFDINLRYMQVNIPVPRILWVMGIS